MSKFIDAPIDINKTMYSFYQSSVVRYYKDIDNLTSLARRTHNNTRYLQEIEQLQIKIEEYEVESGKIYSIWSKAINVMIGFNHFMYLQETGKVKGLFEW